MRGKSLLTAASAAPPFTVDQVEYDFENFALSHGIPETLDPLPYRKAGSVFATSGEEAEPVLTSAKHDPRLRTVVCRHWLRDLCMKGAACEFLHQYDLSKMPLCRHGERCKIKDCPFRHISEANRMECVFYTQGFCIHGPFCRYKHIRRPREDLPAVADFTLGLSQMQANSKDQNSGGGGGGGGGGGPGDRRGVEQQQNQTKRPAPKPNEFYKISLCKHFLNGDCPFGEGCHFAHGEHELRTFPRGGGGGSNNQRNDDDEGDNNDEGEGDYYGDNDGHGGGGGASSHRLSDNMFSNHENTTVDYYTGGASGGGRPTPIVEPEQAHFFIVRAATLNDLAISTVRGEWYVQRKHAEKINQAYQNGQKQVMIFFHVSDSRHIQGAALLTSMATYQEAAAQAAAVSSDNKEEEAFSYRIKVEWHRTTEMPVHMAVEAAPHLLLPTQQTQYCQDMSPQTGESIMKLLWNAPLTTLYESWSGEQDPPANDAILSDFRAPIALRQEEHGKDLYQLEATEACWPIVPGPGFIFGCSSDTMDECLGRGLFGLPAHMKMDAANCIVPGSTIFLFNVTDRLLFGIFEALTPAIMNIEPTAFSKNPKATTSPFPVQVRVRVALECPPLEDTDPVLSDVLRSRGRGRIGALTQAQTQAVASMLASQCGALQYMMDYQRGVEEGANVRAPPIALPPRKIARKETTTTVHGPEPANPSSSSSTEAIA